METAYDVEKSTGNYTEKELLKGINGKLSGLSRGEAMRMYLLKNPKNKRQVMETVIGDKGQSYKLRNMAINELGKKVSADNEAILLKNLNTSDDRILTRVAKALGRTGDTKALAQLQKLRINSSSYAYQSVKFARELIAYRTRNKAETIPLPSSRLLIKVDPKKGIKLETRMANPRKLEKALKVAQAQLPAIKLSNKGIAQIFCRQEEFLIVFNEDFKDAKAFNSLKKYLTHQTLLVSTIS